MVVKKGLNACLKKQNNIKDLFQSCNSAEQRYQKILDLGKSLPRLEEKFKIEKNLVPGCQSKVYLTAVLKDGKVFFQAESDSLISAGLTAILIAIYSGEKPQIILECPPSILKEIELFSSLTPGRVTGLLSIYLKMQKEAAKFSP